MACAHYYHCAASLIFRSDARARLGHTLTLESPQSSWLGTELRVSPCTLNLRNYVSVTRRRPLTATVSLPTEKPERASPGQKFPKWSSKAIKSFAMSELEARKLKYPTTGTEALLMGVLIEGTNLAAKFLRANGITLLKVQDETVKLLGKGDLFFFSPEHPPLTDEAQRALDWAVDRKIKSGDGGELTTAHILLGVWSEVGSPGHKILSTLGFNDEKAGELESLISKPGCMDD
ncbi:ATP-dependent Clp protease ATP-binding subunit CLPT2, chloroplastic [Vigna unguiculata]|uniref:ATP-dependent Clp protease ATP-binding subunit ClpC n=1 Tax=Vigna unguiculata TaxID=3917 RepID=A0A4D6LRI6_VIGUN|nr:ATP-dependent Clp protease ATP-binding subunit CLPT2, chloroplastic [Vigna unguiculata]QCD91599.1 ATP-dependent Clp protease ATP-binding subunit ClpC [Vigna unguiculata]